ncbi:M24 family metallopeptidase [Streptomyces sp. GXMU-J15]|uniref:M24 family metallopeptidase n=1 Tax=Streptomyces fuscus TaxID=3048495 RepID=A0ABT7J035_9ACTN|nr:MULTISPECIES: M24 family metallopeptidase [Streptomyces]MDL2078204.1 M24 family metallopeptidase [Streptomyces fuscus]SBT95119.1 Metallopeptidase family M24 [Streptomyces sp. DI166]
MSKEHFTDQELADVKAAQRLAYDAVAAVEAQLYEGITEKQAAQAIEDWLRERGVRRFFHYGFAWFGDRTRFKNFVKAEGGALSSILNPKIAHFGKQFQPTDRPLRRGDAVILDVGPVVNGFACDMGYSCSLGGEEDEEFHAARMALEPHRALILDLVRRGEPQSRIYKEVDALIAEQGYENIHSYYPGSVIAHKVGKVPGTRLPTFRIQGFSPQAIAYLSGHLLASTLRPRLNRTPLWGETSDRPCEPGLWAVEPHLGKGDIGAKWEELLVVTEDDAYWLDDDLPHVRYWQRHRTA